MRAKQNVWQILSYSDIDYLHRRQESQAELFCDIKKALLQRNRRLYETGKGVKKWKMRKNPLGSKD